MRKVNTGTWIPATVPERSLPLSLLLLFCSIVQSSTGGYDGSCLNGLNILPEYSAFFNLTPALAGLNTASIFIGAIPGCLLGGLFADRLGRRPTMFWFSLVTIIGVVLQTAAQDIPMFVVARIVLGFGSAIQGVGSGVYLNETFPARWRTWGVGMLNNFYYIGALIAAGVTLGSYNIGQGYSSWTWRLPSAVQGIFSVICIMLLWFIPESPRWLAHQGLHADAQEAVALANSNGDANDPISIAIYREIVDTIEWEKGEGKTMSWFTMFKDKVSRRRLLIGSSPGWITASVGNIIASYYLGDELATLGVTDFIPSLQANVALNAWCFVCAVFGTKLLINWGRKPSALACQASLGIMLYIIGGLSKKYEDNTNAGITSSNSLVYGNVAAVFLFQGFYSVCFTPILNLYPAEIMNYSMRANGFAFMQLTNNLAAVVLVYVMPIGIANIGWKMYIINGSWDWLFLAFIWYFWVETKGLTLEEVDEIFEGVKHSSVPDVEAIRKGHAKLDTQDIQDAKALQEEKGEPRIQGHANVAGF